MATMTDPRGLKAGGAVMIGGQVVQAVTGFAANIVLVLHIAPEDFGRFALVLASASLVLAIVSLRISTVIIRASDAALTREAQAHYLAVLTAETAFAIVLGIALTALAGFAGIWAFLLVIVICLRHWIDHNKAFYERRMAYVRLGILETGIAVAAHLAAVVLVLAGAGPAALYWREVLALLFTAAGFGLIGGLTFRRLRWPDAATRRAIVREVRGIWLDAALEGSYQRILVQLAGLVGGERGAGFFFQAQRLAVLPHQVLAPVVGRMAANWFGRVEDAAQRRRGRDRLLRALVVPLLLAALLAWLLADPVVPLIFGAAWSPAAEPLAAMCGLVLFLSLFEVLKVFCVITRRIRLLLAGRAAQYGALFAVLFGVLATGGTPDIETLAVGVSVGFGAAFGLVYLLLWRADRAARRWEGG